MAKHKVFSDPLTEHLTRVKNEEDKKNGLTSGERLHKEILEYVDRNGYVGARDASAVNWLRGNGYLTDGDISQDKVTIKGKQYLEYLVRQAG
jgi:hypothetical protein